MKVTQYFPNWQISVDGRVHIPASPGETPVAITGLPEDEIKRLLAMDAIRKVEYDDGAVVGDLTREGVPPEDLFPPADELPPEIPNEKGVKAAKGKKQSATDNTAEGPAP